MEDLSPKDKGICEFLTNLKVVFDTFYLLNKEYLPSALKAYNGTPHFLPLVKTTLLLSLIVYLFSLKKECYPTLAKEVLAELAKKMRAAASLPEESLTQKRKSPAMIIYTPTDQDEETTSEIVFKRKRATTTPHTEHSHSDGQAPHQEVIIIQECETESLRRKSLWDPDFDVPTHGETSFLSSKDKARLMVHNEDYLLRDTMKQFGQAFAMGCLVIAKARDRKVAEDQRVKENVKFQKEVERLRVEINRLNDLTRAETKHMIDPYEEAK